MESSALADYIERKQQDTVCKHRISTLDLTVRLFPASFNIGLCADVCCYPDRCEAAHDHKEYLSVNLKKEIILKH